MASIFRKDDKITNHPNRNTFDLSSQNNLTLNFGKLVPVFRKEVGPGDSIKIDPTFALRYLPQVFPVQTRQRASVKYYYVRYRNLWKDWPDFIGRTKSGLVPPYLKFNDETRKFLAPSTMADYLGYPIHIKPVSGSFAASQNLLKLGSPNFVQGDNVSFVPNSNITYSGEKNDPYTIYTTSNVASVFYDPSIYPSGSSGVTSSNIVMSQFYGGASVNGLLPRPLFLQPSVQNIIGNLVRPTQYYQKNHIYFYLYRIPMKMNQTFNVTSSPDVSGSQYLIVRTVSNIDVLVKLSAASPLTQGYKIKYTYFNLDGTYEEREEFIDTILGFMVIRKLTDTSVSCPQLDGYVDARVNKLCWCDIDLSRLPFASDENEDGIRLSAFYPRAFESIYNALIRNPENNPFLINGQPEYNKYNLSVNGGATDPSAIMHDYFCNWSDDRFTTALPSPQQGNAPLVGLSGMQGATLTIGNEDGTQQKIKLQVDADTGYVMAVDASSSNASDDLISETWNAVDYGISINDFRNVNSYQRWKENNIRVGYKYRDQISAHYGVSVRFDVLDMPEFIGGVTRDVSVQQVTQMATNADGNLGDIAGQSYVMGEGHSIEHYCDEHGCIIGIMCVYPMPLYQDALDKSLIKQDPFDFYFPEFGKIGNQPITNKEIAFSQSILQGNADEVFGYQRPWYEYLESLDEVHGLYQDDFRNFILARDLGSVPELGSDFLTLHPDDLNNTFYSLDDKDKLLGQIYHKCIMKRPIPLYGIAALE